MSITDTDREPLVRLLHDRIADDSATWELRAGEAWFQVRPDGFEPRTQGWKLHVSATVDSAPEVLARCLDVLLPARCAFKFAASRGRIAELNGNRYTRAGAGKFLTVYPADDDQFRSLAGGLDAATSGLAGPVILSDRPVRPGSLVHYRYGAFVGRQVLTNDGEYQLVIARPDGTLVEDRREAWYTAPDWAQAPLTEPAPAPAADGVLLADRFVVRRAIRHANKGGVFEATDRTTGATVVVKQARAHVGVGSSGWDTHAALRNEARVLELLAPTGIAPRCLSVFEQGGDLFLAQELIGGRTLAAWFAANSRPGLQWPAVAELGQRLVDLIGVVHAHDLVIRDLSPTNLMIGDDGAVHLIDVEYTVAAGSVMPPMGTAGYAAPEQLKTGPAEQTADRYALGALLWLLVTGADPLLPSARYADWWAEFATDAEVDCGPLLLGLLAEPPERRWDGDRVSAFLRGTPGAPRPARPSFDLDRMLADGTDYLLATMTPQRERLWPVSEYGASSDVCNVQNGAAGVLAVLTWLKQPGAVRAAASWIELMAGRDPGHSPGLHFGRSGTLWALHDAGALLGDDDLAARSIAAARDLPAQWPNPDVTHGLAGAGLACLHLWRQTGDAAIGAKAAGYAEALLARVQRTGGVPLWPIPEDFESRLAGMADYGFAHGTAGVATFLLTAGRLLDRPEWVDLAVEAGAGLARVARLDDGCARWTSGPRDATNPLVHWCSGSSGIGTFLLRLWQHTGDAATLALAEQAAEAVWRYRWQATSAVCHGLAGNGEFLLDLADATGSAQHHERAADLAAALAVRANPHDGRLLAPDETMTGFGADYGVGVAGWVAFLHRLRHGGPRRWLP